MRNEIRAVTFFAAAAASICSSSSRESTLRTVPSESARAISDGLFEELVKRISEPAMPARRAIAISPSETTSPAKPSERRSATTAAFEFAFTA